MNRQLFGLAITATAEVRDAAGNLKSAEPITAYTEVTAEELAELGLTLEEES